MKLFAAPILVTLPDIFPNEPEAFRALTQAGAGIIHVRKPQASESALTGLLREVSGKGHCGTLTLHHHLPLAVQYGLGGVHLRGVDWAAVPHGFRKSASCHAWNEVAALAGKADYVFLSPVFDSISKPGYSSGFERRDLFEKLKQKVRPPVVALGGVTPERVSEICRMGFDGVAALGSVWVCEDGKIEITKTVKNYEKLSMEWERCNARR
ncbi:MAG: thiamine phosphate synthase [Rikenellaceae bacterium]|jgi:thiamine-phosphate pyrophosphorylase|nr:thiamine phosphate synthase [Rikenellaceae bacterium]